jgi:hypothetical protein
LDDTQVIQEIGTVLESGDELVVGTARGRYRARRAFSCLAEPAAGDRVVVASTGAGEAFVLAILERPGDEPTRLRVEGDLKVVAAGGRLSFAASEGVEIGTGKELALASGTLVVRSREGKVVLDSLTYLGRLARIETDRVNAVVGLLDQALERFTQRVKRSYRFIEEVDVTRAEQIDMRAKENVHVRGANAVVSADQLVKVDGKQIHLG